MKNNLILAISGNDIFSGGGLHGYHLYSQSTMWFCGSDLPDSHDRARFKVIPVDSTVFSTTILSECAFLSHQ